MLWSWSPEKKEKEMEITIIITTIMEKVLKGCVKVKETITTVTTTTIGLFFYLVKFFCDVSKSHNGDIFVVVLIFFGVCL